MKRRILSVADEAVLRHMALEWHDHSDHAADGTPYGGSLCNCDRVADRAFHIGWRPEQTL